MTHKGQGIAQLLLLSYLKKGIDITQQPRNNASLGSGDYIFWVKKN